ncbi:unnamed protein product [Candidula unifasciata]|uniref:Sulfotransferase domain-containing protein n=1 Tax=Candidula unifasciata TaxID=100452 RepID=A0A8S3YNS1_9EUPU|nr:unnamed protein product [Candidula unifasciata]
MMPIEKVADENGDTLTLLFCNGMYWAPVFNEQAIENMRDLPLRTDDILLCSYPKSGCHWVWEIVRILLAGQISHGEVVHKESFMLEWNPHDVLASLPSPRVLNTHTPFELMPRDLLVKKPKVVFYYRNFKDLAVSFYYHHTGIPPFEYNGSFDAHTKLLVKGTIDHGSPFDYIRGWEKGISENPDLSVFVGSYEDLKENSLAEVRRLSEFLGRDYSDEFLQQVCDFTSFESMKKLKADLTFKTKEGESVMYRKGQVGDWKNHFTVALNEWFDEIIQRENADSKLKFRYTL